MSSILFSNPFVAPSVPNASQEAVPLPAVQPTQGATSAKTSDDPTSFSGSGRGSGQSAQGDTVALLTSARQAQASRPPDATGGSVVNAQSRDEPVMRMLGANLPKVDMPDPLPTSPFLKQG